MDAETRAQLLAGRLRPVLEAELSPDAAGSMAQVLALLAMRAETADAEIRNPERHDTLERDIDRLPGFISWAQGCGGSDEVATLVRRFVTGERAPADPAPDDHVSAASQRRARLRELQRWGVDLSLIEISLRQSPGERIANMERQLRLVRRLQQAADAQGPE
jgi:hypothetical protein